VEARNRAALLQREPANEPRAGAATTSPSGATSPLQSFSTSC
jgi:hypothetical protein